MNSEDKEALYMIRERNGRKEILKVLDEITALERQDEEGTGRDFDRLLFEYLRS